MKKAILSLLILFTAITLVSAQGGAAKKKEEIKQGLKNEVKLTDAQIASVMAIDDEFKPRLKAVKDDQTLSEAAKKEKNALLREEKKKKVEALLGNDTAKKVEEFYTSLKKKKD